MTDLAQRAYAALELRGAVLALIGAQTLDTRDVAPILVADPEAWDLFLRAECCALAVGIGLQRRGILGELTAEAKEVLSAAQIRETQHVMAAAATLREIDRAATDLGIRVTVLKGGVRVAERSVPPLDIGDVDVLVMPQNARALWGVLCEKGWTPRGSGPEAVADEMLGRTNHYAQLVSSRLDFPLEIHETLRYGTDEDYATRFGTAAVSSFVSVDRPTGVAYTVALLRHAVVVHPWRRGHLRDVILISAEMQRLSEDELRAVRAELERDRHEAALLAMYDQCLALAEGRVLADSPSVLPHVALKYLAVLGYGAPLNELPGWMPLSHLSLERFAIRVASRLSILRGVFGPIPPGTAFHRVKQRYRKTLIVPALMRPVRGAYHTFILMRMASAGGRIRRDVQAVLRQRDT